MAAILTELKLDDATIVTALLHDVIEDTDTTRAEIDQLFGPEIGALVDGLTKIKRLDLMSKQAEQAENFRKLLLAISSDIRVLLVKLADRLHNMRTLEHMKPESRKRNSEETLEIYAPLAGRMGMQALRDELEEHAFRWLYPDAYKTVTEKLTELRAKNEGLVDEIAKALSQKLNEVGIKAEVSGREKKPYSVWSKMANKQISLEQLSDIYAFRVVVDTIDDCYRVLGVSHTTWRTVPGRFKDYISTPKQNNYQSIHTTVVGPRHQRVELQIRTREMHSIAEYGVAAHALYKDGQRVNGSEHTNGGKDPAAIYDKDSGPYVWLRRLVETLLEGSNPEEFLEHTKLELFQDQVFCFSPKDVSSRCRAGRHRSTSPTPCTPTSATPPSAPTSMAGTCRSIRSFGTATRSRSRPRKRIRRRQPWESLAVTGRARAAIRRAARDAIRRQYAELGRRLLTAALERSGLDYSDEKLKKALPRLAHKTVEDVLAAVARNEVKVADAVQAIAPETAASTAAAARPSPRARHHAAGSA